MANPAWPASLPQKVLRDGFGEEFPDGLLRTQMDAGTPKQRPRYTDGEGRFDANLYCTEAQLATLKTFYKTTLKLGALKFDWVHPITQATHELRFRSPPSDAPNGIDFIARLNLEVLP